MLRRWIYGNRRRRQDVSAFAPNIGGTTSAFALPANASLFVRSATDVSSGTEALSAGGVVLSVPALLAGQVHKVGWFEKDVMVQVLSGLELLIDNGLGKYIAIGAVGEQPASEFWEDGVFGGPSGEAVWTFNRWGR